MVSWGVQPAADAEERETRVHGWACMNRRKCGCQSVCVRVACTRGPGIGRVKLVLVLAVVVGRLGGACVTKPCHRLFPPSPSARPPRRPPHQLQSTTSPLLFQLPPHSSSPTQVTRLSPIVSRRTPSRTASRPRFLGRLRCIVDPTPRSVSHPTNRQSFPYQPLFPMAALSD